MVDEYIQFKSASLGRTLRQGTTVDSVVHTVVILQSGQIAEIGDYFTRSRVIADYGCIAAIAEYIEAKGIRTYLKYTLKFKFTAFDIAKPESPFKRELLTTE